MAMPESRPNSASRASASRFLSRSRGRTSPWHSCFLFSIILPVLAAILVYRLDSFDPAPFPLHELTHPPLAAPMADARLLRDSQLLGSGLLQGPEDIAFDERSGTIYTGTADGWIKRVKLDDSGSPSVSVEDWVNTGGRPLGVVLGPHDDVIVADAYKVSLLKYLHLHDFVRLPSIASSQHPSFLVVLLFLFSHPYHSYIFY
uniref:Protein YLS2-like n=1 Tax=Rhizophora mucronata TaxID=61149 RepID=A0A2P2K051_RHIMU